MRQNDPSSISGPPTTPDQRPPARVPAWAWSGALVVLMVLTSLAVASVSVWLVLPYLALMALILFTPPGRRERGEDHGARSRRQGPVGGEELADDRAEAGVEDGAVDRASADPAAETELVVEPAEATASDSEPRAVKTRRGKGRMRKAKAVAESPGATATWIQIGPGKFVRVENPGPPVAAASPSSEGEVPGEDEGEPSAPGCPPDG